MRIPRGDDSEEGVIGLTSLMDMMFILLIFYVTTANFEKEERDEAVNLPNVAESAALSETAQKLVIINVRSSSRAPSQALYAVANREMSLRQLQDVVAEAVAKNKNQKVLIRGDEHAWHGDVANAIRSCRSAGIDKVNIGYEVTAGTGEP